MKFLQSADLHLKGEKGRRFEALKSIFSLAQREDIGYVLFAGDFFDKGVDAAMLRESLRNLFSDFQDINTIIVPGNHDKAAYPKGTYLGENVHILSKKPYDYLEVGDVVFVGIPYPEEKDVVPRFFDVLDGIDVAASQTAVAIVHGTLIGGDYWFAGRAGEEEAYNPIHIQDLQEAEFDYYALGHIHQPYERLIKVQNRILAGYPGSPVSITKSETGKRKVIVGRSEGDGLVFDVKQVDSFYTVSESLTVTPHREKEILEDLRTLVNQQEDSNSEVHLDVHGFIAWEENDFKQKVDEILQDAPSNIELDHLSFQTVSEISSPLIDTFLGELDKRKLDPQERKHCQKLFFESVLATEE